MGTEGTELTESSEDEPEINGEDYNDCTKELLSVVKNNVLNSNSDIVAADLATLINLPRRSTE